MNGLYKIKTVGMAIAKGTASELLRAELVSFRTRPSVANR